jgi:hypothetical protein
MTMKSQRTRPKRRQITIEEFDRDRAAAIAAANSPDGIDVADAQGNLQFYMWIPNDIYRDPYSDLFD